MERWFASRTGWDRTPNAWTEALRDARRRGGLVDLTVSNPTRVGLDLGYPELALGLADPRGADYDPSPFGLAPARAAVAAYYARRGLTVRPERIVLVASTSEAYLSLFRLLADPGAPIVAPRPSYPLLDHLADLADLSLRRYRLRPRGRGWALDPGSLSLDGARALLAVSPNNPTGSVLPPAEASALFAECADRGIAVISDEVFADYLHERPFADASAIGRCPGLGFALSGLSKVALAPQLKLSWIVVLGDDALADEALARLEIVLDTQLSVGGPIQWALPGLLERAEDMQAHLRARIAENRDALERFAAAHGLEVHSGDGGWVSILELPGDRTDEAHALELLARGVAVHPGYLYDLEGSSIVVSTIVPPERLAEGLTRIRG